MVKHYFTHKIENLINVKSIITIEYLELYKGYEYPKEKHSFWELVYVDKDSINYLVENESIVLNEGEVLFLHPNQEHSITVKENFPIIFVLCFNCTSEVMSYFFNLKKKLSNNEKEYLSKIVNEATKTFKLPFKENQEILENANLGGQQALRINLELLLIECLRQLESSEDKKNIEFVKNNNLAKSITSDICDFLNEKVYTYFSMSELCKSINYSKTYLSQVFKQIKGSTIISYFNNLKIKEAKKLIRETNMTMVEISDKLSFSDPRYFSFLFKKTTKKTPLQYRQSINQKH